MQTFEEWMKEQHMGNFPQLLDDDIPDHFNDWLGTLDGEDYMLYAEAYGRYCFKEGQSKHDITPPWEVQ